MKFLPALVLTAALGACAPTPDGSTKDDVAFFEDAVASIGCTLLNGPQYNTVQFQAGLTREQAVELVQYELAAGRAERLEAGGVRLSVGACAPGTARAAPVLANGGPAT